jgi:hypothetical protein
MWLTKVDGTEGQAIKDSIELCNGRHDTMY